MSKNIEADREADRKVIQTRNYNGRQFNFSSVEKQTPCFGDRQRHRSKTYIVFMSKK